MRTTAAFAVTLAALQALVFAAGAPPARAQGAHAQVLRSLIERPLHTRLAVADVAVVGTIGEVGLGRIQVRGVESIFEGPHGVPPQLELKRAPSDPPQISAGERCLLLLRGGRTPYLLVDEAGEIPRINGEAEEREWRGAVREVKEALGDPAALLLAYTSRLDATSAGVRRAAIAGLADPKAPFQPLGDADSAKLADVAFDPSLDRLPRVAAALAAMRTEAGREALLAALPGEGKRADPQVLLAGLRAAGAGNSPELTAVLLRALRHPSPEIRRAAISFRGAPALDPELRHEIARLAVEDPEEEVRAAARRALEERSRRAGR